MAVCPNCKNEKEENNICPYCGYESIIEGDIISEITEIKEEKQADSFYDTDSMPNQKDSSELNSILKAVILILMVIIPGAGPVVGILGGVVLLSNQAESNRKFGIKMLGIGIVLLLINIVLCCLSSVFGFFGYFWNL